MQKTKLVMRKKKSTILLHRSKKKKLVHSKLFSGLATYGSIGVGVGVDVALGVCVCVGILYYNPLVSQCFKTEVKIVR